MIQSTLASMPIYLMSVFSLPRKVRLRIEQIQRNFLWGGGALEPKPHLVWWGLVCPDKSKGGLGVKSLSTLNKTLLCKWSWRFANERGVFLESSDHGKVWGGARGLVFQGREGWVWCRVVESN